MWAAERLADDRCMRRVQRSQGSWAVKSINYRNAVSHRTYATNFNHVLLVLVAQENNKIEHLR